MEIKKLFDPSTICRCWHTWFGKFTLFTAVRKNRNNMFCTKWLKFHNRRFSLWEPTTWRHWHVAPYCKHIFVWATCNK